MHLNLLKEDNRLMNLVEYHLFLFCPRILNIFFDRIFQMVFSILFEMGLFYLYDEWNLNFEYFYLLDLLKNSRLGEISYL